MINRHNGWGWGGGGGDGLEFTTCANRAIFADVIGYTYNFIF